jgi:hypothetical protein
MASKITAATLTVKITETLRLNNRNEGGEVTLTIPSINEVSKRIVTTQTTERQILVFDTAAIGPGKFVQADVRYIRITNLDDTNHVTLTFKNHNDDEFAVKLDHGQSYIYNPDLSGGTVATIDAIDGTGLTLSLGNLVDITALADTAACDLEVFVASA